MGVLISRSLVGRFFCANATQPMRPVVRDYANFKSALTAVVALAAYCASSEKRLSIFQKQVGGPNPSNPSEGG